MGSIASLDCFGCAISTSEDACVNLLPCEASLSMGEACVDSFTQFYCCTTLDDACVDFSAEMPGYLCAGSILSGVFCINR